MNSCPADETLELLLADAVAGPELDAVDSHLADCDSCQLRLERMLAAGAATLPNSPSSEMSSPTGWDEARRRRMASFVHEAASAEPDASGAELPKTIGDFELVEVIGTGGMGVVYRGRQTTLKRPVAVKMISQSHFGNPTLVRRFQVEAEAAARLNHPGIVPVYAVGESGPYVFMAMELETGGSLADRIRQTPLEARAAATMLRNIATAVAWAHRQGIIHRDLKPSNILLDEHDQPKVADFGLARDIDDTAQLTVTGEVLGTPSYMPPEQAQGNAALTGERSDVYGLGAILYHTLTGRPPFVGADPIQVLHQVVHQEPVAVRKLNPTVPIDLETIALKCLSKSPAQRYQTAEALVEELDRFLGGQTIVARPLGVFGRLRKWCRRQPVVAALLFTIALTLVVSTVVSLSFATLANRRSTKLAKAQQEVQSSETEARTQAQIARQKTDAAFRVLQKMLFEVQQSLVDDPTAQENRRRLLKSVLAELEQLGPQFADDPRFIRYRATAILGLADVAESAGDDSGRYGSSGSEELYQQATKLFRTLHRRNPGNVTAAQDLAKALSSRGNSQAQAGHWKLARANIQEALGLYKFVADRAREDAGILLAYAETLLFCGEVDTNLRQRKSGYDYLQTALKQTTALVKKYPNGKKVNTLHSIVIREIGDWYVVENKIDKAESQFKQYLALTEKLARRYPLDSGCQMDYSTACERLGDVFKKRGFKVVTLNHYQLALDIAVQLGINAPGNDVIQWDVSFGYQKYADACLHFGELEKAYPPALRCVEMRRTLLAADPINLRRQIKFNHALKTLAKIYTKQGKPTEAAACYEECLRKSQDFMSRTGRRNFLKEITRLRTQIAACRSPTKPDSAKPPQEAWP